MRIRKKIEASLTGKGGRKRKDKFFLDTEERFLPDKNQVACIRNEIKIVIGYGFGKNIFECYVMVICKCNWMN